MQAQLDWTRKNAASSPEKELKDVFWGTMGLIMSQFDGMVGACIPKVCTQGTHDDRVTDLYIYDRRCRCDLENLNTAKTHRKERVEIFIFSLVVSTNIAWCFMERRSNGRRGRAFDRLHWIHSIDSWWTRCDRWTCNMAWRACYAMLRASGRRTNSNGAMEQWSNGASVHVQFPIILALKGRLLCHQRQYCGYRNYK